MSDGMDRSDAGSILDLAPLESGGTRARQGFSFQDHVSARFCLDMLSDTSLAEVWCETQDDITLLWRGSDGFVPEFVQAKTNDLDQLWSVAELCKREGQRTGSSIVERSLANDRCREECRFRIITTQGVKKELDVLTHPIDSAYRKTRSADIAGLEANLLKRVGDFRSPNGNCWGFWLRHALLQHEHSEDSVRHSNLLKLHAVLEDIGYFVTSDLFRELYQRLLAKVSEAAKADWRINPGKKRIERKALLDWLNEAARNALHPALHGSGRSMEQKMQKAALPSDMIEAAQEQRRNYRGEVLRPQYLSLDESRLAQAEVTAALQALRAQLDAGKFSDDGVQFHERCLLALQGLRDTMSSSRQLPLSFLQGSMYNATDRCLHRFVRASA